MEQFVENGPKCEFQFEEKNKKPVEKSVENEPKCEFQFEEKNKKPVEKSEFEEVLDTCWAELDKCLDDEESNKTDFFFRPDVDDGHSKTRTLTDCVTLCKHPDLYLDEQVGTICKSCSVVVEEMRYILPPFSKRYFSRKK